MEALQASQNADIAALRERSVAVIQRWYSMDILRSGDNWADLEGRVERVEQKVRRATLAKRLNDDMIWYDMIWGNILIPNAQTEYQVPDVSSDCRIVEG
jgi:hypothetical protein